MPTGFAVNIDGEVFNDPSEARIPVLDRGFLYGDSIYEVLRTYRGVLFAVEEHFERMDRSASALALTIPLSREDLLLRINDTMKAAGNTESYVRIIITRGAGEIGLDPGLADRPRVIILAKELTLPPSWRSGQGISVKITGIRRNYVGALNPAIKSGNYLNNILAMAEARAAGEDDAIMLDFKGRVTEGTTSNVFAVIDSKLCTPPLEVGILEGVTRKLLVKLSRNHGIEVDEKHISAEDLKRAEEIFFASTLKEVLPIVRLDGKTVGSGKPGSVTLKLTEWFEELKGKV